MLLYTQAKWLGIALVAVCLFQTISVVSQPLPVEHHEEGHDSLGELFESFDNNTDGLLDEIEFEHFYDVFFEIEEASEGHSHHHDKRNTVSRIQRTLPKAAVTRAKRSEGLELTPAGEVVCPSAEAIYSEFLPSSTALGLNETEFVEAVIELTLYKFVEACVIPIEEESCVVNTREAWVWAVLSSLLVSVVSVIGVVLIPIKNNTIRRPLMVSLLGLSAGAMIGDAVLHLLPHGYEAAFSGAEDEHIASLKYGLLCLTSVLLFFIIEKIIKTFFKCGAHSHGHGMHEMEDKDEKQLEKEDHDAEAQHSHDHHPEQNPRAIQTFGWLNLIGDGIHNFVDGMAIGTSFMTSPSVGLSTTLAVLFHEIPQEFGDFALLVRAGFSRRKALACNLVSGLLCVLGAFIGCGIGSIEGAEPWILLFVAGTFLYIAMTDVMPELLAENAKKDTILAIGGCTLGMAVMACMVLIETALNGLIICGSAE